MKIIKTNILFLCLITIFSFNANAKKSNQQFLEDFTSGKFSPKMMAESYSMNDGEHYTMLSDDGTKIIVYSYKSGEITDTIFDIETAKDATMKKISGYQFDPNEKRILINTECTPIYRRTHTTTYYVYSIARNLIKPLSENPDPQQMAMFSPNGRMIAFARNNNLYIKKLDFNTEIAVTTDGERNSVINGTPDWVYEEEFGATRYFDWSPDSKLLSWIRFDEKNIKEFSFDTYHYPYDQSYKYKYPKAGEENSTTSVHVYDVENRTTKQLDCGVGNNIYFPILKWSNDNNSLAIVRLNRNQTKLELLSVNPRSGVAKPLIIEEDRIYIDYRNYSNIHFNKDNTFLAMSERDGYRHIYMYDKNGSIKKQLTKGSWDVTEYYGYNEKNKCLFFQAAKEKPTERHIYKLDKKGKLTNLDPRDGMHSATLTNGMKYIIAQFNNKTTANEFILMNNNGAKLRTIIDNKEVQKLFDNYQLPTKEFFSFTTSESINLDGWVVKPSNFDKNKQYPLVMVQYSGPDSQEALNRFKPDWEYYLANEGYIVACIDGRGTGAKGRKFRTCTYWNLGVLETKDQIEGAKYLGAKPYIDETRMAIWGWSYGGFMTLNAMTNGDGIFKAGIAIAPVTDWALYNTAYTERFMATPQENYAGYEQTDLISTAKDLKGKLLICHGTSDDNVHIQHTMLYCQALIEAGIQFDMQIYPNKNHSILGAKTRLHLYTRFTNFLNNNL